MTDTSPHETNTDTDREENSRSVSPFQAGFRARCPHCGQGSLYKKLLELNDKCEVCGFDLSDADPGDGAIVFVILILGALTTICAIIIEVAFTPPSWVHILLWPVFIFGLSFVMLRVFKALLIALQFHHDAREGRLQDTHDHDAD